MLQTLHIILDFHQRIGAGRPLVADFDNDGYRDVIITNGFPRDVTDMTLLRTGPIQKLRSKGKCYWTRFRRSKLRKLCIQNNGDLTFCKCEARSGY
jgi:hypothetical protein